MSCARPKGQSAIFSRLLNAHRPIPLPELKTHTCCLSLTPQPGHHSWRNDLLCINNFIFPLLVVSLVWWRGWRMGEPAGPGRHHAALSHGFQEQSDKDHRRSRRWKSPYTHLNTQTQTSQESWPKQEGPEPVSLESISHDLDTRLLGWNSEDKEDPWVRAGARVLS